MQERVKKDNVVLPQLKTTNKSQFQKVSAAVTCVVSAVSLAIVTELLP